jgi:hypothetical protein
MELWRPFCQARPSFARGLGKSISDIVLAWVLVRGRALG